MCFNYRNIQLCNNCPVNFQNLFFKVTNINNKVLIPQLKILNVYNFPS